MATPIPCPAAGCKQTFRDDLDPQVLVSLIEIHSRTAHPAQQADAPNVKAEKVSRPSISAAGTSQTWTYFLARWDEYKLATHLTGNDIISQLLACPDESFRMDLFRTYGSLAKKTEVFILEKMKILAVKPENLLVERNRLQDIRQDRDEAVRSFYARLRGQAGVCDYTKSKKCECEREVEVDFSDDIIKDALIRGLSDGDIRVEVLGQCKKDLSLDETLQIIESKESGKRSAGILSNSTASSMNVMNDISTASSTNATSSYMRNVNNQHKPASKPHERDKSQSPTCSHCGQKGHGNGKNLQERRRSCPAYNHQCEKCSIHHHMESVCRSSRQRNSAPYKRNETSNDAVFQTDTPGFFNDGIFDSMCKASESLI